MAQHQLAVVQNEPSSSDDALDDALVAALSSTARGRAFLEEYARRSRAEDTTAALAALARIEAMLVKQQSDLVEARSPAERSESGDAGSADEARSPAEAKRKPGSPDDDHPGFASAHPGYKTESDVREELLTQVMALSPEERIALFS